MKSGGQIQRNAITICRMSKTSWQTGNLNMNEDLVNHSEDQLYYLTHWLDISENSERDKARIQQFERNYYEEFYWLCFIRGWKFGRKIFWLLMLKNWKIWRHQYIFLRRPNAKEVLITQRDEEFVYPIADGSAKLSGRNYEFQELRDGNPP